MIADRHSPKPPPERLSLTLPVINSSQRIWMVLSGAEKASALGLALAGASPIEVPAAGAQGRRRTVFFVDQEAAEDVPQNLIASQLLNRARTKAAPAHRDRAALLRAGRQRQLSALILPRRMRSCFSASSSSEAASSSVRRSFTYARCVL